MMMSWHELLRDYCYLLPRNCPGYLLQSFEQAASSIS